MEPRDATADSRRFGQFLRRIREGRKLSLDAVEEMSAVYPERLTKSHLSRIENGLAEPSFRKMFALSEIYGMPLTALAEQFELDLKREMVKIETTPRNEQETEEEAIRLMRSGRHLEAIAVLLPAVELLRQSEPRPRRWEVKLRLHVANCLIKLNRFESAKAETESVLRRRPDPGERVRALCFFAIASYRLGKYDIALMGVESAEKILASEDLPPRSGADFAVLRGNISMVTGDPREAAEAYRRALQIYEEVGEHFEACRVRINLAAAMIEAGQPNTARGQLEAALLVAESEGYDRLRALAMNNLAIAAYHRGDAETAETWAIRSNAIARPREYVTLVFKNCYYLWRIAADRKDEAGVKVNERTLRSLLHRVEDHEPEAEAFRGASGRGES